MKKARSLSRIQAEVFHAIWDKAKSETPSIKTRAIYLRIEQVKKRYKHTISSRMASNILAAEMGIDIYRLLRNYADELKELQNLIRTAQPQSIDTNKRELKKESARASFGLSPSLSQEASRMANLYPRMYVIENLIRYVVKDTLEKKHSVNWWNETGVVSNDIKKQVESRKNLEGKNRWHYARGNHEVFYTNFGDLSLIIATNWSDFQSIFPNLRWIQAKLEEIELSRNIIAHNNPLPAREFARIDLLFEDLKKQLNISCSTS